jgi:2-keto-4-pentenoate hydratase/2-oxohepta-3-ene-1,7-dioic acid hydratase in catechol pathway
VKLARYAYRGSTSVGAVTGDRIVDLTPRFQIDEQLDETIHLSGMLTLLVTDKDEMAAIRSQVEQALQRTDRWVHPRLADVRLLAPIARPGKIVAIGRNYADHAAETGVKPFENPRIIAKLPSSVVGPGAIVRKPVGVAKLDYEVELGVVIGRHAKLVTREEALDCVAGYTILNDVSAREFQFDVSPAQTTFAKSMDDFCPMGPWIVTRDEIPDPQNLELKLWVNGELLQDGHTRDMIFGVAQLIEYISRYMTLEPGDVIATGTPAGVGAFRKPPRWLQRGDRLELEVSGIGRLTHSIG